MRGRCRPQARWPSVPFKGPVLPFPLHSLTLCVCVCVCASIMRFLRSFALSALISTALAAVIPQQPLAPSLIQNSRQPKWLIELAPYQTRWVTEEEKWALKLVCFALLYCDAAWFKTDGRCLPLRNRTESTSSMSRTSSNLVPTVQFTPSALFGIQVQCSMKTRSSL